MKYFISLLPIILAIFWPWFDFSKTLSSGDWPYLYPENIREFQIPTQPPFLWLEPYYQITAKIGVQLFSLTWEATEKIFWFIPLILLNIVSSWIFIRYLLKKLNVENSYFVMIGSLVYLTNTYFLMLVGGGQMGVAVAFSFAPFVLLFLIRILEEDPNTKLFLSASLINALLLMFDPRVYIITLFSFVIYALCSSLFQPINSKRFLRVLSIIFISFLLNLFWIIPNISYYKQEYTLFAIEPLASFLSFATFSNSISLLHPNWPENVFGKIGFMRPEFVILGIIPYLSLLFVSLKDKKQVFIVLTFAFIGLLGSFLSKGVNPPFGEVYEIFSTLPGSTVFRDPTKFYILTALSYSVLIPLSLYFSFTFLDKKLKSLGTLFVVGFLIYFLLLIKPAILGELSGTFSPHDVPKDYISLKNFITSQKKEFNTLWVPSLQRFGFSSIKNRAISESDLFLVKDISSASAVFNSESAKNDLMESDVKYIVVPYDSLGEIFLEDREYNNSLYLKTINDLSKLSWLTMLSDKEGKSRFGKIAVFEVIYK